MKLGDITHACWLSCVLLFFCVSSQPDCSLGWFGHQCMYKCRCEYSSCDVNGSCIQPYTCEAGWFGPACQYADLAYTKGNVTALEPLTNGNDATCNSPNAGDRITIPFNESMYFTWLRIHVTDQGSDALRNLIVNFNSNTSSVPCPGWKKHAVSKTILDMHCNLSQTITEMTLTGPAVPHLCSVYVSGGRNLALKELAWQSTDYNETVGGANQFYDASKAVDGNIDQNVRHSSCAHTYNSNKWTVTLSRQRSVHRYVIYNRVDAAGYRLIGFMLESFDSMNRSVFVYKDAGNSSQPIYTIVKSPLPVQMVAVTVNNTDNKLTLCEVEIYGDSICDPRHYGRDCEHPCSCANNETCFVSTGACPFGCAPGFFGDSCMAECSVGTFGMNCNESCSTSCPPSDQANVSLCDTKTGECLNGCQSGFSGDLCNEGCKVGTFGTNCNESCSPNCATSDQANVSLCDTKTGACLKGCQSGFSGDMCSKDIPKAVLASASSPMNLILALGGLVSVMFVAAFCVRRKGKSRQTAEGTTSIAHPE